MIDEKRSFQKEFGIRVRAARIKKNLTQQEVADRIGVSYTHYSNLETGKINIGMDTLRKLCTALDVSADYLIQLVLRDDRGNLYSGTLSEIVKDCSDEELTTVTKFVSDLIDTLRAQKK